MSEFLDRERASTSPFVGLRPSHQSVFSTSASARHLAAREPVRASRALMATMPIVLVGSLAMSSLGLAPAPTTAKADQRSKVKASDPEVVRATISPARNTGARTTDQTADAELDTAAVAPATYTVRTGDTVSAIAGRYGLSTASVLALNGLGWKSLIFPGQKLRLAKAVSSAPVASTTPVSAAPVAAPVITAPAPAAANGSYVIQRGDTLTAIAKKLGLPVAALLAANHLTASSIIYAGRTLAVPGVQIALVGSVTVPLSPSMRSNAQTIISVGRSLGVPDYGIVIALATAAQESGLQNIGYGDRDSVGLFQQRPSAGWGTVSQLTSPSYAAKLFFGGPHNPNRGNTRGLLDISGWQSMTLTQAAQAVQISGSPTAYAKWEASARFWFAELS